MLSNNHNPNQNSLLYSPESNHKSQIEINTRVPQHADPSNDSLNVLPTRLWFILENSAKIWDIRKIFSHVKVKFVKREIRVICWILHRPMSPVPVTSRHSNYLWNWLQNVPLGSTGSCPWKAICVPNTLQVGLSALLLLPHPTYPARAYIFLCLCI